MKEENGNKKVLKVFKKKLKKNKRIKKIAQVESLIKAFACERKKNSTRVNKKIDQIALSRIRTYDLLITSEVPYQLGHKSFFLLFFMQKVFSKK